MVTRDEKGRVVGGVLNPGGRPKEDAALRQRCRDAVDAKVVERWIVEVEQSGPDWVKCSELLAHYGYGKPTDRHEVSGSDGQPLGAIWQGVSTEELGALVRKVLKGET